VLAPLGRMTRAGRYSAAVLTTAFTLAAGLPGMSGAAGLSPGTVARTGTVPAVTASGPKVPVTKPVFIPTPVHPEKITHPGADYMGAVNRAHARWGRDPSTPARSATVTQLPGIDISSYQGNIHWASVAPYIDFVYAKATEGTYYTNPDFYNQYEGPYNHGVIRGAYHFAVPSNSSGQAQADFFIKHGGGWSSDGLTLPGALDIEYNPYGRECYGLTHAQMVAWVWNFVHEYAYKEHAYPVIYSTTDWWSTCTGNYGGFGNYDPLWIARYATTVGPLPSGWGFQTFWQYASGGRLPGDQDLFNGAYSRLKTLAIDG
jgi:GH25 family lysozyme M1 (1,4-beta-N-acetylmuramidase)